VDWISVFLCAIVESGRKGNPKQQMRGAERDFLFACQHVPESGTGRRKQNEIEKNKILAVSI
jgi:hypothetical protein